MPLRKIYDFVRSAGARFTGDVDIDDGVRLNFGDEGEYRMKVIGSTEQLQIFHSPTDTLVYRANPGNELADELAAGGETPISQGALNPQDPTAHAGEHKAGGADELDAAELSGASGTAGQFLKTDGSALTFDEPTGTPSNAIQNDTAMWSEGVAPGLGG